VECRSPHGSAACIEMTASLLIFVKHLIISNFLLMKGMLMANDCMGTVFAMVLVFLLILVKQRII
jgi:uncharacterized membrane protein